MRIPQPIKNSALLSKPLSLNHLPYCDTHVWENTLPNGRQISWQNAGLEVSGNCTKIVNLVYEEQLLEYPTTL